MKFDITDGRFAWLFSCLSDITSSISYEICLHPTTSDKLIESKFPGSSRSLKMIGKQAMAREGKPLLC